MGMPEIPESLSELDDAELAELAAQLQQVGRDNAEAAEAGDVEAAGLVEQAANAFRAVLDEQARREEEKQETATRVAEALEVLNSSQVESSESDAAEGNEESMNGEWSASKPTELDLSHIADPVGALSHLSGESSEPAVAPIRVPAVARRSRYQRRQRVAKPLSKFVDLGSVDATLNGKAVDRETVARAIATKFDWFRKAGSIAGSGPLQMFQARTEHDVAVRMNADAVANSAVLRSVSRETAVAASGGSCAIPVNNYDVFNAAQPITPVEGFVPVVGAEARGAIRYLSPPDWQAAKAGVTVITNDEDIAGATKPCVHFDCPTEVECVVDAVPACAEFGNLTYRTAPELVEVLLDQLAVAHAQAKEISYLDAIDAASTQVTADVNPYGAIRSAVWALSIATFAYRKRNHIPHTVPLDVLAPDTLFPVLKADAVADLNLGYEFIGADMQQLAEELFNSLNVNIEFYYDYTTADGPASAMQQTQGPGSQANLPLTFKTYVYAPGTWVRLDGGVLNIGLIRDSSLQAENNLQIWSEEFTVMCMYGSESLAFELELCPSGVGPNPVTALTCTS